MRTRYAVLGILTFLATFFAFTGLTYAEEVTSTGATQAVPGAVTLQPIVVSIIAGCITPLLTGFATKLSASPGVKAVVSLVFVSLATVLTTITTNDGHFLVRDIVVLFLTTLTTHAVSYLQVWEPIGQPGSTWAAQMTPNLGIGGGGT